MDHTNPILDLPPFTAPSTDLDGPIGALTDGTEVGRYMSFALGGKRFCIAASAIAEITGPLAHTFLPGSPTHVAGLAPFRGEALAVIALRELLDTGAAQPNSRPKSFVLRSGGLPTRIAFEIDRLLEVVAGGGSLFTPIETPGIVDAEVKTSDGTACRRIDGSRLYSLLKR
jgi:chemotaxis signal transduction protein